MYTIMAKLGSNFCPDWRGVNTASLVLEEFLRLALEEIILTENPNLVVESENQVQAIMFGTNITYFEDVFAPFNTYLVSIAQVKEPTSENKRALNDYIWTIDRSTIVELMEKVTPPKDSLQQPTRLSLTTFDTFEYKPKDYEIDILAIVINGNNPTKTESEKRVQEFIIMDKQKKPTKLALWDSFIDYDGIKLLEQLPKFPVILARRVSKATT
ncbi:hypothetical protein CQW23_12105, partial [Capsicum baccatum]